MAFSASLTTVLDTATIELVGELDASTAPEFHGTIDAAADQGVSQLVIRADALTYLSSAGLRSLVFARQKMGDEVRIVMVGAAEPVAKTIRMAGFHRSIVMVDE